MLSHTQVWGIATNWVRKHCLKWHLQGCPKLSIYWNICILHYLLRNVFSLFQGWPCVGFDVILLKPHISWLQYDLTGTGSDHANVITVTSWWVRWCLKSPTSPLFTEPLIQGTDHRKHQSSASLFFVWQIHRWPVISSHKGPVTRKMFSFHDVIMVLVLA